MRALAIALLGVAVATAPALAQEAPKYDPNAEVTVTGVVVDYHESKKKNDHPGLHFILKIASARVNEPDAPEDMTSEAPVADETTAGQPEAPAEPAPPLAKGDTIEVHACPMDLLGYLDFTVEKGDELTVNGSRPEGGLIIVAREIVKGTVTLQVRDPEGVPVWTELP